MARLDLLTVPISRYADDRLPSGGLDTTMVALHTGRVVDGQPVVGYGFTSFGRYGQAGLIRERFGPRLLAAGTLDPLEAWAAMMAGEKPGGHGERCVAVGALDMALWDAAAKIAGLPLYRYLAQRLGRPAPPPSLPVYAGGGYDYPQDDLRRLADEMRGLLDQGYTHLKIKIGAQPLAADLKRIEAVLALLPGGAHLAVDAMNRYGPEAALAAGQALAPYGLRWFEDVCDPLDFEAQARLAAAYAPPLAAGEALFSLADARNLLRYGGLRPERDVLLFDPAHCYGLPEYARIVDLFESAGWPRSAFQPHGGHLFSLHVAAALGLGGCEANPHNFQPFGGFGDSQPVQAGRALLPEAPGIGFETRVRLRELFLSVGKP
jgi:L-alanine-DL-glutamate epimerase-like enolase superfamily enzyme